MSSSIAKIYADTVRENQRVLYGVWEPGFPVQLGDYGVMKGNIFVQLGNLRDIDEMRNFKITKRTDNTKDEKFFTSQKGVQFELKPKVAASTKGAPIKASIDINFTKENSVFFNAAECQFEMIENKFQVGQKLLEIYKQGKDKWKREFVLVTDRVIAKRALILISTSNDYSISFEADSKITAIDLAKASLGLSMKSQKSSGYKVVTEEGLTPLIGLSKIQSKFLWIGSDFKPISAKYNKMMVETIQDSPNIKTERNSEDLMFAQYTENLND
jgi:hypothetical protein